MLSEKQKEFIELYVTCQYLHEVLVNTYHSIKDENLKFKNGMTYDDIKNIWLMIDVPDRLKSNFDFKSTDYYKEFSNIVKSKFKKFENVENVDFFQFMVRFYKISSKLLRCDKELAYEEQHSQKDEINYDIFNKELSGEDYQVEHYETSILDNYRNWGIERICLDGIQNHLKEDSKGNNCLIQFFIDDRWVSLEEAKDKRDRITKIRFADDGVGFDSKNLQYLSSQKSSEDHSAGQFGEGLKLIAMASINLGLDIEVQSQNWVARAYGEDETIKNYRTGTEQIDNRKKLCWEVKTYENDSIKGSRTIFNNPSKELIEEVFKLPERILELSDNKILFSMFDNNQIIDDNKRRKYYG